MECEGPRIDGLVRDALEAFIEDFTHARWWGKEHDCVNRFVHGFLVAEGLASGVLAHPTQVGIEVGVAQPKGFSQPAARKDVVIWPEPWMSCWNESFEPVHKPIAVLEWKLVRTRGPLKCHVHDRAWLGAFAEDQPEAVGYAVTLNRDRGQAERISVVRFSGHSVDENWLRT
jgi:hypothetical protein